MALLQVRDFPQQLYTMLAALAQSENRSITQQSKNAFRLYFYCP